MNKINTAVIQAGGKGTRLKELTRDEIPKPLIKMNGKPMLEWQISNLKRYGVSEIIIIIGHLGNKIKEYFEDGSRFGVHIDYIEETLSLGSAGALFYLKQRNLGEDFFLIYGDVMFDIDLNRMETFHKENDALATLLVHPNTHPQDSDLIVLNDKKQVVKFALKNQIRADWYDNCVNAGIYILSKDILDCVETVQKIDLEKDILQSNLSGQGIYGYQTTEYVKDAGTTERFFEVENACRKGIWADKNLENPQKCIFLDRDGTINSHKGLIASDEQFVLEENAAKAIKLINESGYLAIVITNQPVVARGLCSMEDVFGIHRKMSTLLGEQGAYLDDIAFCPHHPDKGYPEENVAYKIKCNCRKPSTGLIDDMVQKYHIDISSSYMIGDTTTDIQTGVNAGLKTILLHTGEAGTDKIFDVKADMEATDLLEAVLKIFRR
jgi:histidinol-phosphate phosphatase family protein